jgi:hypothetical protein
MSPSRKVREGQVPWFGSGATLVRHGSKISVEHNGKVLALDLPVVEKLILDLADMVHAAKHWKARGE